MEIYIIRHTKPDIEKGVCYGQTDLGLANTFTEEFKTIKTQIPIIDDFKVISSPLQRCVTLAKQFSDNVTLNSNLKELNFGDWEMKTWNTIPENEINPWMEDFVNIAPTNGESYTDLAHRVNNCFKDIINLHDEQNLIILTHAGPIRALLSSVLNIPLEKSFNIKIQYGEVFHLKKEKDILKVISKIDI